MNNLNPIRKLKEGGPKCNIDIQSIQIGGPNRTKSKLIEPKSNQNQEKTQNRKSRDRNEKYHKLGVSPALLRAGEREKRGRRFNRPSTRPRTFLGHTRHRGRKTTRRRIEIHGGISSPATVGHRTRHLNRAWGV